MAKQHVPVATYRLQLHRGFHFDAARELAPYLRQLGVSHLYSSPIGTARPGSTHGYDVVDPTRINEELGGQQGFARLAAELRRLDMGWLLDIVPNHMATASENPAWMDVIKHGRASRFAPWFDIAWNSGSRRESAVDDEGLTLPVLGKPIEEAIDAGEISIQYESGRVFATYFDRSFPLDPRSMIPVFEMAAQLAPAAAARSGSIDNAGDPVEQELHDLARLSRVIPDWRDQASGRERYQATQRVEERLQKLCSSHPEAQQAIRDAIKAVSLREVLDQQPYRLCHWKRAMRQLTYRRFFDITDLIGVRVEDPEVFHATHELVLRLVAGGSIDGLRIDHIDGLADPARYLEELRDALQERGAADAYVIVEKILAGDETLDNSWPVAGTTGYDFLNVLAGLFVDRRGLDSLAAYQEARVPSDTSVDRLVYEQKKRVAKELFGGEVEALTTTLAALSRELCDDPPSDDEMREAIVEASACLSVYRTYITRDHVRERAVRDRDRQRVLACISAARHRTQGRWSRGLDLLERLLLVQVGDELEGAVVETLADFIAKWQQFTGPLAAKGVEDTALYRDARLVSLNTVGADPESIESPGGVAAFHRHNQHVAMRWPRTMTTTSTHDTKRSEDVRSRIHVLSEISDDWIAAADRWREANRPFTRIVDGQTAPGVTNELFLYQTMLGAWPIEDSEESDFVERMAQYAVKAAREAKARTSWVAPNVEYERAVTDFVRCVLDPAGSPSRGDIKGLARRITFSGALNALSRTLLKIVSPGIPDFYQGTELWDFSLVDPDNRRPVDFELRKRLLQEIATLPDEISGPTLRRLLESWRDGRVKLLVTQRGLKARAAMRDVFLGGDYVPLQVTGGQAAHICACARRFQGQWCIAVAPILTVALGGERDAPLGPVWTDTTIPLPDQAPIRWRDAITGNVVLASDDWLRVADALRTFPVALLTS